MTLRGSFDEDLIELFHGELDYLRSAGADFARKYPKLASRLDLGGSESTDPQVERLLETIQQRTLDRMKQQQNDM